MKTATSTPTRLTVETFPHEEGCRAYLLIDSATHQALAIDPRLDQVGAIQDSLRRHGARLTHALDTHTHADHLSGVHELCERTGARMLAHARAKTTRSPERVTPPTAWMLGETEIRLIAAPGHTPDSLAVFADGRLYTGDALFVGGAGRTDFPGGSAEELYETFRRFEALPAETIVMPGHVYGTAESSTLAAERANNPLFAERDRAALVARMGGTVPEPANMLAILRHNMGQSSDSATIAVQDAAVLARQDPDTLFLDVRTAAEYAAEHISGARRIGLEEVGARSSELGKASRIVLVCRTGQRAQLAADRLSGLSARLQVLEGGMVAWRAAGLPIREGAKKVLPLDRQVQLIVGSMVLIGTLLGAFVNPWLLIIPGFFGAGLAFAGATGTCALGMMLARMPWNQVKAAAAGGGAACAAPASACAAPVRAGASACAAPNTTSACAAPVRAGESACAAPAKR
jgi:glyoxylase-like metal-dependent hydrolase (beta-lactamase superfamily II)